MKQNKRVGNLRVLLVLIPLLALTRLAGGPWWIFVIPVFLLGILLWWKKKDVAAFRTGFLGGFVVWIGAHLYFQLAFGGILVVKTGLLAALGLLLFSGLTGGLLTGLALYTGRHLLQEDSPQPAFENLAK